MNISTPIKIAADRVEGDVIARKSREALKAFGTSAPPLVIEGTSHTLVPENTGRVLLFTSNNAISLNVPATLEAGFSVAILQWGEGVITFVEATGVTINSTSDVSGTTEQFGSASLFVAMNVDGESADILAT